MRTHLRDFGSVIGVWLLESDKGLSFVTGEMEERKMRVLKRRFDRRSEILRLGFAEIGDCCGLSKLGKYQWWNLRKERVLR